MIWDKWLMQLAANANLEVSDTDDDAAILKDCYVAILSQNKGGVVEISDVTLKKK